MKIKTSELSGIALDWAVAKCENIEVAPYYGINKNYLVIHHGGWEYGVYNPSSNWSQGGPIIEREKISLEDFPMDWEAKIRGQNYWYVGSTPLEAAMRCYVASKLGDEVEISDEFWRVNHDQV